MGRRRDLAVEWAGGEGGEKRASSPCHNESDETEEEEKKRLSRIFLHGVGGG